MILYIDRYHLDDVLFLRALTGSLGSKVQPGRMLICHGSGELVERLFEAEARFPERIDGVLKLEDARDQELFERGMRDTGRKLSGMLTDAVVPAVPLVGMDRGLVTVDEDGVVRVGRATWLEELLDRKVVPVLAAMARRGEGSEIVEIGAEPLLEGLTNAYSPDGLAVFVRMGSGLERAEGEIALEDSGDALPDSAVVESLLRKGVTVHVITPARLRSQGPSEWPRLAPLDRPGNP